MRQTFFSFLTLLLLSLPLYGQTPRDTVPVSNAEELLNALQSNRVIIVTVPHINLQNQSIDIQHLEHLTITCLQKNRAKITTSSSDKTVVTLDQTEHILFKNLSLGHWPDVGYCTGNVMDILNSKMVSLDQCDLFGSGVIGIYSQNAEVSVNNSIIRECSEDIIATDYHRSSLRFQQCDFYLNDKNQIAYPSPYFEQCRFFSPDSTLVVAQYSGFYPSIPLQLNTEPLSSQPAWTVQAFEEAPLENACPNTFKVTTSSHLANYKNNTYHAENLSQLSLDPGAITAWVEGSPGNGIGEKITLRVQSLMAEYENWGLSGAFKIVNGYAKNKHTWRNNNRIKRLKISRNGKLVAYLDLEDTPNIQRFDLGRIVYENHLTLGETLDFEIIAIYKGDRYNDTALSYLVGSCVP